MIAEEIAIYSSRVFTVTEFVLNKTLVLTELFNFAVNCEENFSL